MRHVDDLLIAAVIGLRERQSAGRKRTSPAATIGSVRGEVDHELKDEVRLAWRLWWAPCRITSGRYWTQSRRRRQERTPRNSNGSCRNGQCLARNCDRKWPS